MVFFPPFFGTGIIILVFQTSGGRFLLKTLLHMSRIASSPTTGEAFNASAVIILSMPGALRFPRDQIALVISLVVKLHVLIGRS